jgi:hypothetical protein
MNHRSAKRLTCAAITVLAGLFAGNAIAQQIDGHPDFSGLWTTYRGPTGDGGTRGGPAGQAGDVSLTPLAQEKVDAYRAVTEGTNHSPGAYCVGSGMPSSMVGAGGYPMEFLQHPRQINVTYELHGEMRRIYIGDHGFDLNEIFHERNGFSVGRWEDDTLVVETTHLKAYPYFSGLATSSDAHVMERIRLEERDVNGEPRKYLVNDITLTDPKVYTQPVLLHAEAVLRPDLFMLEYTCTNTIWEEYLEERGLMVPDIDSLPAE